MTPEGWQRIEGALMGVAALLLAVITAPAQGWVWLFLLAPELGLLGYLLGPRAGAFVYNAVHLYGWGALLALLAVVIGPSWLVTVGAMWMAHIGFERAAGWGLRRTSGFRDTHLGRIGGQGNRPQD